jgi:hypothetical protein
MSDEIFRAARGRQPTLVTHHSSRFFHMNWNPEHAQASPMLAPLRIHGGEVFDIASPALEDFGRLLERREPPVHVANGKRLRVVQQGARPATFEERYEPRAYLRGELQVRPENGHDTFNVLAWLAFPAAKAALNARHYAAQCAQRAVGTPNRGPAQDALTLFDESGVIVASDDAGLLDLLRAFRWKELFWTNRDRVRAHMRFWLFGHALGEKALRPFIGMTGRAILLDPGAGFIGAPPHEQLDLVDRAVAKRLSDPASLASTRELAVVPVLGVPGWWPDNEREAFYDNTEYFRPGRRSGSA